MRRKIDSRQTASAKAPPSAPTPSEKLGPTTTADAQNMVTSGAASEADLVFKSGVGSAAIAAALLFAGKMKVA